QDRGGFKWGGEEGAGGMRFVMLGEDELLAIVPAKVFSHLARQVELAAEPNGHRLGERNEARGSIRQVGFQQPLELEQRLVVETDVVDVGGSQAGFLQAELHGPARK